MSLAMCLDIDIEGIDELEKDLAFMKRETGRNAAKSITHGLYAGVRHAKANHPWKSRSALGAEFHTVGVITQANDNGGDGWFGCTDEYASFLEYGTRAHEIHPKAGHGSYGPLLNGQSRRAATDIGTHRVALRWYTSPATSEGPIFARVVHHPGTKAMPWINPALKVIKKVTLEHVEKEHERVARELDFG
jgi:hypothetical protein